MRREWQIELFRIGCMFGIVFLHAMQHSGQVAFHRGLDNLASPCVVGFLFISGYFGIRLSRRSVWRLLSTCAICVLIVSIANCFKSGNGLGGILTTVSSYRGYGWFVWTYLALMLVAPLFDPLFQCPSKISILKRVVPSLILVFVWSYLASIHSTGRWLPEVEGFSAFGLLTFLGVYLAARLCRVFEVDRMVGRRFFLLAFVLSGALCWFGFRHYNSPAALVFAGSAFYLMRPIHAPAMIESIVLYISPSMLAVYLLHANDLVFGFMKWVGREMVDVRGYNWHLVCVVETIVIFMACVTVDICVRAILKSGYKLIKHG